MDDELGFVRKDKLEKVITEALSEIENRVKLFYIERLEILIRDKI